MVQNFELNPNLPSNQDLAPGIRPNQGPARRDSMNWSLIGPYSGGHGPDLTADSDSAQNFRPYSTWTSPNTSKHGKNDDFA